MSTQSIIDSMTRDEYQRFNAEVYWNHKCPIDESHSVLSWQSAECFGCRTVAVLAVLVQQNEVGSTMEYIRDLTSEARDILSDFCRKDRS